MLFYVILSPNYTFSENMSNNMMQLIMTKPKNIMTGI